MIWLGLLLLVSAGLVLAGIIGEATALRARRTVHYPNTVLRVALMEDWELPFTRDYYRKSNAPDWIRAMHEMAICEEMLRRGLDPEGEIPHPTLSA